MMKYALNMLVIISCIALQEVGVCSVSDISNIAVHDDGVTETVALGARGIYGNELASVCHIGI